MPPKRKSTQIDEPEGVAPRRSTRQKTAADHGIASAKNDVVPAKESKPGKKAKKTSNPSQVEDVKQESKNEKTVNGKKTSKKQPQVKKETKLSTEPKLEANDTSSVSGRQYWLLKAEPESRIENGTDVKFSIDDLAAKKEPEPWDGIRNYVARNNLRAMKKGDLAFFYHSNCKEPGIVGTMEIVQEHSPDLSAHDPKAPYYDPKSKPEDPKWSVVHVEYRSKFIAPIVLKELREMGASGKPLENMQMLKQSRLSVSKVSEAEWVYLNGVAAERAGKA